MNQGVLGVEIHVSNKLKTKKQVILLFKIIYSFIFVLCIHLKN